MARLIDADALKEKIEQSGGEGTIARYCKRVLAECLDNDAPTIDAIPVAWLEDKLNETAVTNPDLNNAIFYTLVAWEQEKKNHEQ